MAFIFRSLTIIALARVAICEYHGGEESHGHHPVGYSYAKFSGPVAGPDHKIEVHDKHGHLAYDYVAHPQYNFEYGVEDAKSHVSQKRQEHRDGDDVHGEYTVAQPDGKVRTVKYSADKHSGFTAEVLIDGKPLHHDALEEQQQHLAEQQVHLAEQAAHAAAAAHGSHMADHQSHIFHEVPEHSEHGGAGGAEHGAVEESYGGGYEAAEEDGGHEYY